MDENEVCCKKCGHIWEVAPKKRKYADLCSSCRAKPAKTVRYGDLICIPHSGKFDEFDRPVVGGRLYLPGSRICGHGDCINPDHIGIV